MKNETFRSSLGQRITGLDELRGIAILVVLFAHFTHFRKLSPALSEFNLGAIGVDLFFIISGYLIMKILLKERGNSGAYQRFYVRRIFRILPLFFVALAVGTLLAILLNESLSGLICYFTFSQNLLAEQPPIGDLLPSHFQPFPGLAPLWSLAVEEHTYLLLPLLSFKLRENFLKCVLVVISVTGIFLKFSAAYQFIDTSTWMVYSNPHETWFRMQYIAIGSLLALSNWRIPFSIISCVWIACAGTYGFGLIEWFAVCIMVTLVQSCVNGSPFIRNRALARLGVLCYGIYILHVFIMVGFEHLPMPNAIRFPLFLLTCYCVAELSFQFF